MNKKKRYQKTPKFVSYHRFDIKKLMSVNDLFSRCVPKRDKWNNDSRLVRNPVDKNAECFFFHSLYRLNWINSSRIVNQIFTFVAHLVCIKIHITFWRPCNPSQFKSYLRDMETKHGALNPSQQKAEKDGLDGLTQHFYFGFRINCRLSVENRVVQFMYQFSLIQKESISIWSKCVFFMQMLKVITWNSERML